MNLHVHKFRPDSGSVVQLSKSASCQQAGLLGPGGGEEEAEEEEKDDDAEVVIFLYGPGKS